MKIKKINRKVEVVQTYDITTRSGAYALPNGCVSHNSSLCINSTNGIEMPMSLISTKESKSGSIIYVVPEYTKLKKFYQIMWDQKDCISYIKTAAVLAAYIDQSISTNTFYSPRHFPDRKIPATLIAKNLMLAHYYGLKTLYYSLIEKQGSKPLSNEAEDIDEDCESCKL